MLSVHIPSLRPDTAPLVAPIVQADERLGLLRHHRNMPIVRRIGASGWHVA
jgi:hypothetical protein